MPRRLLAPRLLAILLATAGLCVAAAPSEDGGTWPGFRGADRDGVSTATGLLGAWPEQGPPERWRRPLGDGFAGVAIAGTRGFTLDAADGHERLLAFATADGATLWDAELGPAWRDHFGDGPRATPTVAGDTVYALGSKGVVLAAALADGAPRWRRDLAAELGARPPQWGLAGAPLVEAGLVIVNAGGRDGAAVLALDAATGEERWRALDDNAGYAAPLAVTIGGVRQVVVFTATTVAGLAPGDGAVLWSLPWKTSYDVNAATPVFVAPDRLFVSSGYDTGAALLRIVVTDGKVEARQVWRSRVMKNQFSSPVLRGGVLYGFDDSTFKAVDAATGEMRWRTRGFGHGSLIAAGDLLYVLGDRGQLALVRATPAEYREISRLRIVDGKTWAPPSLAAGALYIRSQRELVSLRVTE